MPSTTKLPGWVKTVLSRKDNIERALGMPIGEPLGCGHWGCVFRSEGPWVVKLTRDPTEGPIWARLREWIADVPCCTDGIVRIKDIVRIQPDLKFGRRTWPIHAIVREEAVPASPFATGEAARFTKERLGIDPGIDLVAFASGFGLGSRAIPGLDVRTQGNVREYAHALRALDKFKEHAQDWHREKRKKRPNGGHLDLFERELVDDTNHMNGPIAGSLGETLTQLVADGIVLQDVHLGNIGWRVHEEIDGDPANPDTLVIFDPGHTPTGPREDIRELSPNARPEERW